MAKQRRPDDDDDDDGQGYLTLERLARYSGLSISTLRRFLHRAHNPMPHLRLPGGGPGGGRVLVRKQAFDQWLAQFASGESREPAVTSATSEVGWLDRAYNRLK